MRESDTRRVLTIGDIHGCSRAFNTLLAQVRPQPQDRIVTLGDYVNRGPDSCGVIEQLLMLRRQCRLVALRGNHEMMMLAARQDARHREEWLCCGGTETLASYGRASGHGSLDDVPNHHWDFLGNTCRSWYATDTHFFVHANAHPEVPLDEQPDYMLYWEPFDNPAPHISGKVMVCGHTSQKTGVPRNLGHAICLDTYAHGDGWLTCLDVTTGRVWQANQAGGHRIAWIEDYLEHPSDAD